MESEEKKKTKTKKRKERNSRINVYKRSEDIYKKPTNYTIWKDEQSFSKYIIIIQ